MAVELKTTVEPMPTVTEAEGSVVNAGEPTAVELTVRMADSLTVVPAELVAATL